MNICLKTGRVVMFFVVVSLVFITTTHIATADKDHYIDNESCKQYNDGHRACFPFKKPSSEYTIEFKGIGNNSFNQVTISNIEPEEEFFALWDFGQCEIPTSVENYLFCLPGQPPADLLPYDTDTLVISSYIWIEGVEGNADLRDSNAILAGEHIGKTLGNSITITISSSNTLNTDFKNLSSAYKEEWKTLFGINEQSEIEPLDVDNFCKVAKEKYQPYTPGDIKSIFTEGESLSLQVPGYPVLGGDSLDTIAEDSSLSSLVAYFYRFSLAIAGVIAFLSLLYAGILFILSGDSPDTRRRAVSKVKKVFIGVFILLSAVLIFEFIGLDINATNNLDLEVKKVEGEVVLPNDRNTILIQDTENHIYYGIPFTNRDGANRIYKNLITQTPGNKCLGCGYEEGYTKQMACHFACDSTALLIDKAYGIGEFTGYDRLKNYLYAIKECEEIKKDSLYQGEDEIKYAIVSDDDDTPVSCAAACIKIAGDGGVKCDGYTNQDQNKKFSEWINDGKLENYTAQQGNTKNLYPQIFFFGRKNSLNDSYLQDKSEKDRSGLRQCIGENYVIDAQQFPVIESQTNSTDICVCRA